MQQNQKTKRHDKGGRAAERRKKEVVEAERREHLGPQGGLLGCQSGKSNVVSLGQPYIIPRASRPPPISPLDVCFLFPLIDFLFAQQHSPTTASDYATHISPADHRAKPKSMGIHTAVVGAISSCSSLESLDRFLSARTPQWPPGC